MLSLVGRLLRRTGDSLEPMAAGASAGSGVSADCARTDLLEAKPIRSAHSKAQDCRVRIVVTWGRILIEERCVVQAFRPAPRTVCSAGLQACSSADLKVC